MDEREYEDVVQDWINRFRKSAQRGTGMKLSAREVKCLAITIMARYSDDDPRDED